MKRYFLFRVVLSILFCFLSYSDNFYDLSANDLDGKKINFTDYKGKVVLVVNTASGCGFSGQYEGLQELNNKYKSKGLVVLGFPSNDFHGQEPMKNNEIKKFCKTKYNVDFQLFEKNPVTGSNKQNVYKFLTESDSDTAGEIDWNFEKFLINKNGEIDSRYGSLTGPTCSKLIEKIEELLNENN